MYPFESDFQGTITPVNMQMNGLGATAQVTGEGTIGWKFRDDYGGKKYIQVKGYHVPASEVRLFSSQQYFLQE